MLSLLGKSIEPEGDTQAWCHAHAIDYRHPVDDPSHFSFCAVPEKGFDALAFMAVALLVCSVMQGKMAALYVLVTGGVLQALALVFNLGPMGNAINLWLNIEPAELFLYGFLPPLLLESSLNIEFFLFRKVLAKVITFAFLVVLGSTALMVPWLLFGLGLSAHWSWVQVALFVAVIASTDAVTVNALLKSGGGPEEMVVLLEGESLFNDSSSMVLFTIFFNLSENTAAASGPILPQLLLIAKQLVILALGGAAVGYVTGYLTRKLLGWMQLRRCQAAQELAVVFAMSYLAFYVGQALLEVSGVIAVVVYGLYGCAKGKWEISNKTQQSGEMTGFFHTITHGVNGLVFFYAGASSVNFVWRSIDVLATKGLVYNVAVLLGIYVSAFVARYVCIAFFNVFFSLTGHGLPSNIVFFATISALRGALSLIMAQVVIQAKARENEGSHHAAPHQIDLVTAQLVFWSSGFVLLTLLINAPLMPWFMRRTGLVEQSRAGKVVRAKARRALLRFTAAAIRDLKEDDDEILRGVDWKHVEAYTDLSHELLEFGGETGQHSGSGGGSGGGVLRSGKSSDGTQQQQDTTKRGGHASPHVPSTNNASRRQHGLVQRFISVVGSGHGRPEDEAQVTPLLSGEGLHDVEEGVEAEGGGEHGDVVDDHNHAEEEGVHEYYDDDDTDDHDDDNTPTTDNDVDGTTKQPPHRSSSGSVFGRQEAPLTGTGTLLGGALTEASLMRDVVKATEEKRAEEEQHTTEASHLIETTTRSHGAASGGSMVVLRHAIGVLVPPASAGGTAGSPSSSPQPKQHGLFGTALFRGGGGAPQAADAPHLPQFYQYQQQAVVDSLVQQHQQLQHAQRGLSPLLSLAPTLTMGSTSMGSSSSATQGLQSLHRAVSTRTFGGQSDAALHELQAEARMRLVGGLKRFLHAKRAEGLLSSKGLRILDFACDEAIDKSDEPLCLWASVEAELVGRWWVTALARWHLLVRRLHVALASLHVLRWTGVPKVLSWYSGYLSAQLSEKLLLACETALAYYLALSFTPFAQWLTENGSREAVALQCEMASESKKAWQFIVDREVEAPERFQAIQSYRAAMAVMHQQVGFVGELYQSGMIDEAEREMMEEPIEKRIVALERAGATWRAPRTREIIASLPFLENLPTSLVNEFIAAGTIQSFHSGDVICTPLHVAAQASGMYVVINGMVKGFVKHGQHVAEFFLGSGRVFGLMSALTGEGLPGSAGILAAGNALGKGPILFYVPRARLQALLERARLGDASVRQLEVDMYRMACLYTVERLRGQLLSALTSALFAQHTQPGGGVHHKAGLPGVAAAKNKREETRVEESEGAAPAPATTPEQQRRDARQEALGILQRVRDGLANGKLYEVGRGEVYTMTWDTVLIKGVLSVRALVGGGPGTALVQLQGPSVLPWLGGGGDQTDRIVLHAESDCLLIKCGQENDDDAQDDVKPLSNAMAGLYAHEGLVAGGAPGGGACVVPD